MPTTTRPEFDADCQATVGELRSALLGLYRAVGADPAHPQDVSRRFKLHRNLTWKLAKVLQTDNAYEAAATLPGTSGLEILLNAMKGEGAPSDVLEQVRRASSEFEQMVEVHTGDRATLELVLDSMGNHGKASEQARKLAFRGNSGIRGMQCRVRVTAQFVAQSAHDPSLLDVAMFGGSVDMRRLRKIPRWPTYRSIRGNDAGTTSWGAPRREPLDGESWFLSDYCSGAMPEVHTCPTDTGMVFELGDGPIGRTGEFTCLVGQFDREVVPRFASPGNELALIRAGISIPAKTLLLDLFVHRDMTEALGAELRVYGDLPNHIGEGDESLRLPRGGQVRNLGQHGSVATPLVDRYGDLVALALNKGGWERSDFNCLRVVYEYPPMPSTIELRYALPEAPRGDTHTRV